MTSSLRTSLTLTHRLLDVAIICAAFLFSAESLGANALQDLLSGIRTYQFNVGLGIALLLIGWQVSLSSLWFYRSKRLSQWQEECGDVIKAASLCTLVLAAVVPVVEWYWVSRSVLIGFWISTSTWLFTLRLLKRLVLREFRKRGRNIRRVVIVGTGPRAQQMATLLESHPELGYQLIGFVDDVPAKNVLGPLSKMAQILTDNIIDEMMIALPIRTFYEEMATIARIAEEQGVTVRVHSDLFNLRLARVVAEQLDELPVVSLYTGPRGNWEQGLKRLIDIIASGTLLILLSPLLLLIAAIIKITSPGPAIFSQARLGYNKRRFKMFKFRTMVVDAEQRQAELEQMNEAGGPVFKMKHDPRITPTGHFLRRTSLDELPQLINVFLGDLSLVGPRPLPERDFQRFDAYWLNRRFSVKPGITCIWQISGRSNTSFDHWIRQDLEYIDGWSLLLDIKILFKTIPAVLRGTGAM